MMSVLWDDSLGDQTYLKIVVDFFADIWYADIFQLTLQLIDIYVYVYFLPIPHRRDHQVSSVVEFIYSIISHTLTVMACQQMQA